MQIESLNGTHYEKGFLECLSFLKKTELTRDRFGEILRDRISHKVETVVVVVNDKVVATAAIQIEPKFYGNVGHIEDVVTHEQFRGRGLGGTALSECIEIAKRHSCYKVILDCADHNVEWYTKNGFYRFENQMRLNLPVETKDEKS